jgi:ABC-type nickel/cobalt efflux system permease component RcnA
LAFGFLAIALVMTHFLGSAHAQSSLGIGTNDGIAPSTGPFAHILMWINLRQQEFYRALATAMKAMREDGSKLWLLIGLSFAYGIFHAAGPGHGKAVISSYMVANEVALRRGIMLSFVSALLQALTAIVVIILAYFVLRGTAISMTDAAWFLEVMSFALITLFGAWLLWRKAGPAVHAAGEICETCGHSHAPDPALLSGDRFDWRTAWSAVAAVGIRPCSGALIVLSFALLNGLWFGGILSVLAMALGTAITVAALATLAVTAKNWAVYFAGDGRLGNRIHSIVEIGGAAFVFMFGLLLLSASLSAGG